MAGRAWRRGTREHFRSSNGGNRVWCPPLPSQLAIGTRTRKLYSVFTGANTDGEFHLPNSVLTLIRPPRFMLLYRTPPSVRPR